MVKAGRCILYAQVFYSFRKLSRFVQMENVEFTLNSHQAFMFLVLYQSRLLSCPYCGQGLCVRARCLYSITEPWQWTYRTYKYFHFTDEEAEIGGAISNQDSQSFWTNHLQVVSVTASALGVMYVYILAHFLCSERVLATVMVWHCVRVFVRKVSKC